MLLDNNILSIYLTKNLLLKPFFENSNIYYPANLLLYYTHLNPLVALSGGPCGIRTTAGGEVAN